MVGELANVGAEDLERVRIIVTFYDDAGEVALVENTYADLSTIAPGQSSPFKIMTIGETVPIASYRVQTQQ